MDRRTYLEYQPGGGVKCKSLDDKGPFTLNCLIIKRAHEGGHTIELTSDGGLVVHNLTIPELSVFDSLIVKFPRTKVNE